jgi:hypothetical protein
MVCGHARAMARAAILSVFLAPLASAVGHAQDPAGQLQGVANVPSPAFSAPVEGPAAAVSGDAMGAAAASGPDGGQNRATPSGHPLWRLPLGELTGTRERPIFSATRRPPPAPETPPPPALVSAPGKEITRPPLSLLGAIAADEAGIAIFLDEITRRTVRLKVGEGYAGWTLALVKAREATLIRDQHTAIVALPPPR